MADPASRGLALNLACGVRPWFYALGAPQSATAFAFCSAAKPSQVQRLTHLKMLVDAAGFTKALAAPSIAPSIYLHWHGVVL